MVADGSGKHYACILRLRLINLSQQQPPSAASMMSIKWSHVPIRANVVNFPQDRQLENEASPSANTRQHVGRPLQSESDQITWLKNFPLSRNPGRKYAAFNYGALKTRNVFPVECPAVLRPLQTCARGATCWDLQMRSVLLQIWKPNYFVTQLGSWVSDGFLAAQVDTFG